MEEREKTAYKIKERAKQIVTHGTKLNFNEEWTKKYFDPFGKGLNEEEALLLHDLVQLFIDYLVYGFYSKEQTKKMAEGYFKSFMSGRYG
ncbi:MAG: hypothetical protein PWP27_181 [Clostridiales bacterium]|nr:hypothetical protein [Clostridiales bacterium]